jgi:hypothetical protein
MQSAHIRTSLKACRGNKIASRRQQAMTIPELSRAIGETDAEFLVSLGISPYNVMAYELEIRERVRTRILRVIALLQAAGILGALYWTMMN